MEQANSLLKEPPLSYRSRRGSQQGDVGSRAATAYGRTWCAGVLSMHPVRALSSEEECPELLDGVPFLRMLFLAPRVFCPGAFLLR